MNKEMDPSLIAVKIGEDIPAIRKQVEEQKRVTEEERRRNDPRLILREKIKQAKQTLEEQQERIFNESNVVEIFNQLRDQKILVMSNEPVYVEESVLVKRNLVEKLFKEERYIRQKRKISDFAPAVVSVSKNDPAYFYEDGRLVHWSKNKSKSGIDHYDFRAFIDSKRVSIIFNRDKCGEREIFVDVQDNSLVVHGKEEYVVDEEIDLISAIELALANPLINASDFNIGESWKEDIFDREPSYTYVKVL